MKVKESELERPSRRPYAPPAVSWEDEFEVHSTLASACGKVAGGGDMCDTSVDMS